MSVVIWLVVEIIAVVVCLLISIWCVLCNVVCWLGCLGSKGCYDNCVSQGPCIGPSVEIEWDYPTVGTGTGTGTGTGIGAGTGTGTETDTDPDTGTPNQAVALAPQHVEVITRVDQLEELVRWQRLLSGVPPAVRLELSNANREQSRHAQSGFDRYRSACGCREGKIGMLAAGVLLLVAYLAGNPVSHSLSGWPGVGLSVGVVLLGALAGKLYGLLRATFLLRRTVHELRRSLQPA